MLVRRNDLLVLDLGLHTVGGIGGLNLKGNRLPSGSLDENNTAKTQNEVEGGVFLKVIIRNSVAILELLASVD